MNTGADSALAKPDAIVFDCDGVLIDTRRSYDAAIAATVDMLLRWMFGVKLPWTAAAPALVSGLRRTGEFNNDWDAVYVITLFASCCLPSDLTSALGVGLPFGRRRSTRLPRGAAASTLGAVGRAVREFGESASGSSRPSVDRFADGFFSSRQRTVCEAVRKYLGYPGNPPSSVLATLFDEMYHGPRLYRRMYGLEPRYFKGRGFIDRDKVIVRPSDLAALSDAVEGRLAISTGRPRLAVEYSLRRLISFFRVEASSFIGDADVDHDSRLDSFRKPSGKSLLWAQRVLGSRSMIYVGDSAEDSKMVADARRSGGCVAFVGVYSASYNARDQVRFFRNESADLILPSVRALPAAINGGARR